MDTGLDLRPSFELVPIDDDEAALYSENGRKGLRRGPGAKEEPFPFN